MTDDQESLLDDILALESGLTAWEIDFAENLDASCRTRDLSEKQSDVLNRIAEKNDLGEIRFH